MWTHLHDHLCSRPWPSLPQAQLSLRFGGRGHCLGSGLGAADSLVGGELGEGTESIPWAVEAVDVLTPPSSSLSTAASRLF